MFKNCALLSLCVWLCASVTSPLAVAADFATGQGARLVIGQTTFTTQASGASATLLGGVGGIAFANGKLFIADANRLGLTPLNHRVLIMDTTGFPGPLDEIPPDSGRCPVCVGEAQVVLGQPDFTSSELGLAGNKFRLPTGVASDGHVLAVSDTQNNRVLLWHSIPTTNGQPADVVLGQNNFDSVRNVVVNDRSLRAPQGVWIQNGRLYVADTQNHRVMIWNSIPTQNDQPADVVLGQPNFNVAPEPDLSLATLDARPDTLLNPVSVTSDGVHLFVSDLGHNRVLIWNEIPTQNQEPADVVVGQPNFTQTFGNNVEAFCTPLDLNRDGVDDTIDDGDPATEDPLLYPARCGKTLDFPRYALSDGQRLFIADGGNDRVMVYNTIPTTNGVAADVILGQPDEFSSVISSVTDLFNPLLRQSAADIVATPSSLAWDGTNLYVNDASNRRVMVFTPGESLIPINGVRNSASREIFSLGSLAVRRRQGVDAQGFPVQEEIRDGDVITATINDRDYSYTTNEVDSLTDIMVAIAAAINANGGDPDVIARFESSLGIVKLQAKVGGTEGNDISIAIAVAEPLEAGVQVAASGAFMQGGGNATVIAPGTLVSMLGTNLSDVLAAADLDAEQLPLELGRVQAYFDGIRSPLLYVSPDQVNAQFPFEVLDSNNVSFYLRIERDDGSVVATTAIAVPTDNVHPGNPGIFAFPGEEPRPAVAFHFSSRATGLITVSGFGSGSLEEGDVAIVTIEDRVYNYRVRADDTLKSVQDSLIALINRNPDEVVVASEVGSISLVRRILLTAKIPGPAGNGITYAARSETGDDTSVLLVLSSSSGALCCSNVADAPVTDLNPAIPGEMIYLYATGLGPVGPLAAQEAAKTGEKYRGPAVNYAQEFVASLAGGAAPNVVSAGLEPGSHGLYKVVLQLSPGTPVVTDTTQLTISQHIYTSNVVEVELFDPNESNFTGQ